MYRLVRNFVLAFSSSLVVFLLLGASLGKNRSSQDVYQHFEVFSEVLSRIKSEYVEEPDMKSVTLGALNGLLEAIDPFASYLSKDQYAQYKEDLQQKRADVGLLLSRRFGYVSVVDAIPGMPADRAGLRTGDMLEAIDGVATRDMPLAYAEILLRGLPDTSVRLTVLRVRAGAEPQEVSLKREWLKYPPVRSEMLPGRTGLIRVRSLEAGKTAEVAHHLRQLKDQGMEKLILDLRRSAAGEPEEGVKLADFFLDQGLITYLEGQKYPRKEFKATPAATLWKGPMVVVINRGTAQGAEIAASALLENKRCEVVGERSYGYAGLRQPILLQDGSAVILSVAKYYSPGGKAIQDTGVVPSVVEVAAAEETEEIRPQPEPPVNEDNILQKAIEVLAKTERAAAALPQADREGRRTSTLATLLYPH